MSYAFIEKARLGKKNQMVLPSCVRKRLGIAEGDEVLIKVEGNIALIIPKPKSYASHLCGLHSEIWRDVNIDQYVSEERNSWDD